MASGTELRNRIFAMSGAILFFVSACTVTVAVIVTNIQSSDQKKQAAATASAQTECPQSPAEAALPAPEVYKPDTDVTALQSTDLTVGSGQAAKNGDCLIMKYYGTLATSGALFDETYTKATGFGFTLGEGKVIEGWDKGLVGMKVGGERRLVIPSELAYGAQSPSESIPANSDLVFVVKLIRIQK